jgi:hypothetical protein
VQFIFNAAGGHPLSINVGLHDNQTDSIDLCRGFAMPDGGCAKLWLQNPSGFPRAFECCIFEVILCGFSTRKKR